MRFEARDLRPYAEPLDASVLVIGSVYFLVNFFDEEMLVPNVETLIFAGANLDGKKNGLYYFQNPDSYHAGIRYDSIDRGEEAFFSTCQEDGLNCIFEFEKALDVLLRCSLMRQKLEPS